MNRIQDTRQTPIEMTTAESPAIPKTDIRVRALAREDSIDALTSLLHRAYRAQVGMGLNPLAGRQPVDVTRRRATSGECFVACDGRGEMVGTVLLNEHEDARFPDLFLLPDVAHFSLLAVEPDLQGAGVGGLLLDAITERARRLGFARLACSMAEPDTQLGDFYLRRGYEIVEYWQWPYTNYRSAILCKAI